MFQETATLQAIVEASRSKNSILVVGLDPDPARLPGVLAPRPEDDEREAARKVRGFCLEILEATAPFAAAFKLQSAYFEALGVAGVEVYRDLLAEAGRAGLPTIADVKRGDIGSTARAYARAHLSRFGATCVTVNPYMGSEAVEPFLEETRRLGRGGGVFSLVATSNPSSVSFQGATEPPVHEVAARLVAEVGLTGGDYPDCGAVVGATRPEVGERVREILPDTLFLVPGFGAQGGGVEAVAALLDARGGGVVVNSSRAIIYAFEEQPHLDYREAAAGAAEKARRELSRAGRGL